MYLKCLHLLMYLIVQYLSDSHCNNIIGVSYSSTHVPLKCFQIQSQSIEISNFSLCVCVCVGGGEGHAPRPPFMVLACLTC